MPLGSGGDRGCRTPAQHPAPRTPAGLHRGGSPSARPLARSFPAAIAGAVLPVPPPRSLKAKRSAVRPPPPPPLPLRPGPDATQSIGGSMRCIGYSGAPKCGNFTLEAEGGGGGKDTAPAPLVDSVGSGHGGGCSRHCPPGGQSFPCGSAPAHEVLGLNPIKCN